MSKVDRLAERMGLELGLGPDDHGSEEWRAVYHAATEVVEAMSRFPVRVRFLQEWDDRAEVAEDE